MSDQRIFKTKNLTKHTFWSAVKNYWGWMHSPVFYFHSIVFSSCFRNCWGQFSQCWSILIQWSCSLAESISLQLFCANPICLCFQSGFLLWKYKMQHQNGWEGNYRHSKLHHSLSTFLWKTTRINVWKTLKPIFVATIMQVDIELASHSMFEQVMKRSL